MKIEQLNSFYTGVFDALSQKTASPGLWGAELDAALARRDADFTDTDDLLAALHDVQRVSQIFDAGLENDAAFRATLAAAGITAWKDFGAPPVDISLQHSLAGKLYNAKAGDTGMITLGDGSREIGKWLVDKCMAAEIPFTVKFAEQNFESLLLNHADEDGIRKLAESHLRQTARVTKTMVARGGLPMNPVVTDQNKENLYKKSIKPFRERVSSGEIFYTLTEIPSRKDAEIDRIPYNDYIKLFFEMCDQPWDRVTRAQAWLIEHLNAGKTLRMTNSDGTDIGMSIDGFTFCNSVIAKNVPGSEVFSAPVKTSLNGKIVAKGRFEHNGQIIEDLTLVFKSGRLADFDAAQGRDAFAEIISVDDGARYAGEIGIGTNPHLKQHVANGLLVEKIGGSFHIALGAAYTYTQYGGIPVTVNNGNESALHWDITTMLYGKNGRIYLDSAIIMDNGLWLAPELDVLNRGWESVSESERPEYWKTSAGSGKAPAPETPKP